MGPNVEGVLYAAVDRQGLMMGARVGAPCVVGIVGPQHAASEPWQHGEVELVKPRAATINVESLGR